MAPTATSARDANASLRPPPTARSRERARAALAPYARFRVESDGLPSATGSTKGERWAVSPDIRQRRWFPGSSRAFRAQREHLEVRGFVVAPGNVPLAWLFARGQVRLRLKTADSAERRHRAQAVTRKRRDTQSGFVEPRDHGVIGGGRDGRAHHLGG